MPVMAYALRVLEVQRRAERVAPLVEETAAAAETPLPRIRRVGAAVRLLADEAQDRATAPLDQPRRLADIRAVDPVLGVVEAPSRAPARRALDRRSLGRRSASWRDRSGRPRPARHRRRSRSAASRRRRASPPRRSGRSAACAGCSARRDRRDRSSGHRGDHRRVGRPSPPRTRQPDADYAPESASRFPQSPRSPHAPAHSSPGAGARRTPPR